MKKSKGMQLGALLIAVLLVGMAFVPTLSIAATDPKISDQVLTQEEQKQLDQLQKVPKKK